jgi:hypothetical protein
MADWESIELNPNLPDILNDIAKRIPEDWLLPSMLEEGEYFRGHIVETLKALQKDGVGTLRDSYQVELVSKSNDTVDVGVFSSLVYAEIQDTGDDIFPKKKWLAFPHKDAKRYVGTRWAKDFGGKLNFALSKHDPNGTAYLFEKGREKPVFILKKQVHIPGMLYLDWAAAAWEGEALESSFGKNIGLSFGDAGYR